MQVRVTSGSVMLDFTEAVIFQLSLQIDAHVRSGRLTLVTPPGVLADAGDVAADNSSVKVRRPPGPDVHVILRIQVSGEVGDGRTTARPPRRGFSPAAAPRARCAVTAAMSCRRRARGAFPASGRVSQPCLRWSPAASPASAACSCERRPVRGHCPGAGDRGRAGRRSGRLPVHRDRPRARGSSPKLERIARGNAGQAHRLFSVVPGADVRSAGPGPGLRGRRAGRSWCPRPG
jgi:hypothetical protein